MAAFWTYDWGIWASLFIGLSVRPGASRRRKTPPGRRRAQVRPFPKSDLPWEDLLELLKTRYGAGGKSPENEELSSDELLATLLADQPKWAGAPGDTEFVPGHPENKAAPRPLEVTAVPPDAGWQAGDNRRATRRRDANPVEVMLISSFHENPVHGLVINRSTGGLAILTDVPFEPDTVVGVRAVDAPSGVGFIDLCVRHSREASKLWLIGCQYKDEIPWKAKVWFG